MRTTALALVIFTIVISLLSSGIVAAEGRRFRIGVSCPLSGVLAEYGTAVRNGIELARRDNPERFAGVEIIFEDSQWDPKVAVSVFRALRSQHKVDLVFNWGNPTSEAIAPIAERGRVPTIVMSSDPRIAAGKKYIVRSINSAVQLGQQLAKEVSRRGFRSVGVIVADNSYVGGVVDGLSSSLQGAAQVDIVDRVPLDTQDFRSVVAKMKSRNYDVLGIMLISGQLSAFYRQMQAQDLRRASFGPDFLDSSQELQAAGTAVEGAFHPNFDVVESFRLKYQAEFGNDAQIPFAANAYDVTSLLAKLFGAGQQSQMNIDGVMDAIRGVRDYDGANGRMSVHRDESGDVYFEYPLVIKEARHGASITLRN
jgi:branched-chain amino acid transport system substrate-binding protein